MVRRQAGLMSECSTKSRFFQQRLCVRLTPPFPASSEPVLGLDRLQIGPTVIGYKARIGDFLIRDEIGELVESVLATEGNRWGKQRERKRNT